MSPELKLVKKLFSEAVNTRDEKFLKRLADAIRDYGNRRVHALRVKALKNIAEMKED